MDSNFAALQQLHSSLRVAIYCRLSKDDNLDGESASIQNQRDMLETWCQEHGFSVAGVYADDGYSGLYMDIPLTLSRRKRGSLPDALRRSAT